VVHGIASMEDMKKVGRVGLKALIYFEVMTTVALIIGLLVVNIWRPGVGMNIDPAALDTSGIAAYTAKAAEQSTVEFFLHIIPTTVVGAFAEGEILQVLFFAVLFAFALQFLGERGKPLLSIIDQTDDKGQGRHDLEVDQSLHADAADLLHVLHAGDAVDDGAEDDRGDQHLDQLDEQITKPLQAFAELRVEVPDQHAENDGAQDLEIEVLIDLLVVGWCGRSRTS
jgi:hypothetical protein